MQFVHQPLTWGFFLVLVPLLIHLINMMRHRRVAWAAMDFLLQSYKKHRKWIWLKQLLLLLMRMAAVALVVAMLAQWITQGQWMDIFGGRPTHHYVLLDDSYSMSDRAGGNSAFELGLVALQRIASQAAGAAQTGPQKFTLIRYSRAARAALEDADGLDADQVADFNGEIVDSNFDVLVEAKRNTFQLTELSVGPLPALAMLRELIELAPEEKRLVYVVTDFRAGQWENPAEAREILRDVEESPADIHLVGCVREARRNLAVINVEPAAETQAAGVPLFVNITVKNFGPEEARNIQLKVHTDFYDTERERASTPDQLRAKRENLPTVLIDQIPPGQTVMRRVQVFFPRAGRHVVQASLLDDPVAVDNHRWSVLEFPEGEPVLVIDGSDDQHHGYYLQSAFQPGGRANTGVVPELNTAGFLRDASLETLQRYRAIYLLDVPRLDDRAVENLESYVSAGGGLGVFLGPEVNTDFYNTRLYQNGLGLMPMPLGDVGLLPREDDENIPDVEPTEHPVFDVFLGERNTFIRLITIAQYVQPVEGWNAAADPAVQVAAFLRDRMPLAVERQFGEGRVLVFTSTLAPDWNNWSNDPSFVVMALRMQSHLASPLRVTDSRPVGSEIVVAVSADGYRDDVVFVTPGETPEMRLQIEDVALVPEPKSAIKQAAIGDQMVGGVGETDRSGIYEAWPVTVAGQVDVRRFALNVEPDEGDLSMLVEKRLLDKLDPIKAEFRYADEEAYELARFSGNDRSLLLMGLLIGLLLAEQLVAYSASYHPARNVAG